MLWLARKYAVLDGPSFPIIAEGEGEEPNDTYVEQLTASARAAVEVRGAAACALRVGRQRSGATTQLPHQSWSLGARCHRWWSPAAWPILGRLPSAGTATVGWGPRAGPRVSWRTCAAARNTRQKDAGQGGARPLPPRICNSKLPHLPPSCLNPLTHLPTHPPTHACTQSHATHMFRCLHGSEPPGPCARPVCMRHRPQRSLQPHPHALRVRLPLPVCAHYSATLPLRLIAASIWSACSVGVADISSATLCRL
jgi:hypothetical protein